MSVSEYREEEGELSVIFILGTLISGFPKPFLGSVFLLGSSESFWNSVFLDGWMVLHRTRKRVLKFWNFKAFAGFTSADDEYESSQ